MHWIKKAFLLFLLMWVGVSFAQTIEGMRMSQTPTEGVRFVADLDKKADVKVFRLDNPSRLVLDFAGTRFGQTKSGDAVFGRRRRDHRPQHERAHAPPVAEQCGTSGTAD